VNRFVPHLLRFFLPWACVGCRSPLEDFDDQGFCGRCWLSVPRIQGLICLTCGIPLRDGGNRCYACRHAPTRLTIRAASVYQGVIPPAIYRFKYTGRRTLIRSLGVLLMYAWEFYPELHAIQGIIPVPLFPRNEKIRGFNQAELLASHLARGTSLPMLPALLRLRKTRSQYELNRPERRDNVRSAFGIHPYLAGRRDVFQGRSFLLIDDICTTTSTLRECAEVLYRAGAKAVKALVLARDL